MRRRERLFLPVLAALACACPATVATADAKQKLPPVATTLLPTDVDGSSAVLHGVLTDAGNQQTTYWFELGTTTAYGVTTQAAKTNKAGTLAQSAVTGLSPGTTYHARLVARNDDGVSLGADIPFKTTGTALPTPTEPAPLPDGDDADTGSGDGSGDTAEPAPAPAAPPSLGESVAVQPAKGTVLVRVPGASAPTALSAAASVPVGSVVDTRAGAITLSTALPGKRTQTATFRGGLFEVRQAADTSGMVELVLRGPAPVCPKGGARAAAATAKRPPRQLWARDDHGRFRTRGSNSVATVRGTSWYVADRCDGTLTRVSRGAVSVRDLHTNRTVTVRAGHSYLARAAR